MLGVEPRALSLRGKYSTREAARTVHHTQAVCAKRDSVDLGDTRADR